MRLIGKVLWWDGRDKEGVIVDPDGNEYYFNSSVFPDCARFKTLEDRFVKFSANDEVAHLRCAKSISVIPNNSASKAKKTFENSNRTAGTEASVA